MRLPSSQSSSGCSTPSPHTAASPELELSSLPDSLLDSGVALDSDAVVLGAPDDDDSVSASPVEPVLSSLSPSCSSTSGRPHAARAKRLQARRRRVREERAIHSVSARAMPNDHE